MTNRSFSVAHNDAVSHVSPLESSSSVLLNQPVLVDAADGFFDVRPSFDEFLLLEEEPPRRKPSIALPMMRASTIALLPSHFNLFNGDLCSFFFPAAAAELFALGLSFDDGDSFDVDDVSVNLSNVSRAKVTVAWAEDFTVFCRFDAGM